MRDRDDIKAYASFKEILSVSNESDEYYHYLDEFAALLDSEKSYERIRGFSLCCAQSRLDTKGRIAKILPKMLSMLNDTRPTAVRQYLAALTEVAELRPELRSQIKDAVKSFDLSMYKDSMVSLIREDINTLLMIIDP